MATYLVTFPNVFEHAKFKETFKDYFEEQHKVEIIHHSRTFCEVTTKHHNQFFHLSLSRDCPGVNILFKQQHKNRLQYTKL